MIAAAWVVFRKELVDALRDRRTLTMVLLSSVALGPLLLMLLSALVGAIEQRAEARQVQVVGLANAPTLRNHIERQTWTAVEAAPDALTKLQEGKLRDALLVLPADFEARLAAGERPTVEVMSHSSDDQSEAAARRIEALLRGFTAEVATQQLILRGVSPALVQPLEVQRRDLAEQGARAARLAGMVPFFVLMAVVYGCLTAALDTTAGERERGSLEPLLANPLPAAALVAGKWAAVAGVGLLVAVLSCLSFLPGQWLLRSETLSAMFRFGPAEAFAFIALLAPLAAAVAAVIMAIAIRSKSFKEAQASTTIVVMVVSLLPLITIVQPTGGAPWQAAVPGLAQTQLMTRVLQGEPLAFSAVALSVAVCAVLTVGALASVARSLKAAALK
jgi:sodium transport system permease protein